MIRIAVLAVAVLVLVAGIAFSQGDRAIAEGEEPTPTPEIVFIEEEPTPTSVPEKKKEQEYAASCMWSETGDANNGCDEAEGGRQYTPPTAIPTRKPKATATPRPRPTATPVPRVRATATPRPDDDDRPRSSSRSSSSLKPTKAPPAPTGVEAELALNLTHDGKNDITLRWNNAKGVSYYRVLLRVGKSKSWTRLSGNVSHSPMTYKKLRCDTTYTFKVEAYGDGKTYTTDASPISPESNRIEIPCVPELPEPGWRLNCPWASRVDPRDEDDAIVLKGSSDRVFHAARSAMYRPLLAILTAVPSEDGRSSPILWCAFASIESASTEKVTTTLKGGMYHGTKTRLC